MFEEIGHAIDQRLNSSKDSAGDEGAVFSALLRGVSAPENELSEDDLRNIYINGELVEVEAAAPTLSSAKQS